MQPMLFLQSILTFEMQYASRFFALHHGACCRQFPLLFFHAMGLLVTEDHDGTNDSIAYRSHAEAVI